MEEQVTQVRRPRRRKKTQLEIIKEVYLPYIFLMIAAVFFVVCIIGSLIRNANEDAEEETGTSKIAATVEIQTL